MMRFKTKNNLLLLIFFLLVFLFLILQILYHLFPISYISEINHAASLYTIDPALIAATIKMESNFNERAVSSSGAFGLMQLMPDTAEWLYSKKIVNGNWRQPEENILMGSYYLKSLINRFEDVELALNGYHKGPNKIQRLLDDNELFSKKYSDRIFTYEIVYNLLYSEYFYQ